MQVKNAKKEGECANVLAKYVCGDYNNYVHNFDIFTMEDLCIHIKKVELVQTNMNKGSRKWDTMNS